MTISKVGLIAPDFPPMTGGVSLFAGALASSLSEISELTLFTMPENQATDPKFNQKRSLSLNPKRDASILNSEPVDAWLAVNAGSTPLARLLDKPFFAYFHGNDFLQPWLPCGPRWLEKIQRPYAAALRHSLRRRALKNSVHLLSKIYCNSKNTAALVQSETGVEASRITIRPPGVRDEFFSISRPRESAELRILTVATLSRFAMRKNIDAVLEAIRLLRPKLDIAYTVVGGGDDLPRLKSLATDLGIEEQTYFKGYVSFTDLVDSFSQADLFVLASKATQEDVEGFGMVYMEASAAGIPSICSREGGGTDAIQEGLNGILIERSSPECIAAGIERFVVDRDSYSPAAIRELAEGYRWEFVAQELLNSMNSTTLTSQPD